MRLILFILFPVFIFGQANTTGFKGKIVVGTYLVTDSISYRITPARVGAYVVDTGETVTIQANKYYFMKGTFTNIYTASFIFNGDTLTYNNGNYRYLVGRYDFVMQSNQNNTVVYTCVSVNDNLCLLSKSSETFTVKDTDYEIGGNIMIMVNTGDKIKIVVASNNAGAKIKTIKGSTYLHQIP